MRPIPTLTYMPGKESGEEGLVTDLGCLFWPIFGKEEEFLYDH